MTVQFEDIASELHAARDQRVTDQIESARHQVGVSSQMSELQADAKWSIYCEHIQTLIKNYEQAAEGHQRTLSGNEFLTPQQYGECRVKLSDASGMAKGLTLSLSLVTVLVDRGESAAEELVSLTKGKIQG